ncbi:MAG: DUF5677 domain-containing protein [Tunicatimonas sp.]
MYFEKIQKLYNQIDLEEIQAVNLDKVDEFELTVKIAFCKSIQLNQIVHKELFSENSFLYLSTLRGICEETIVLKFIDELISEGDKSELIKSLIKDSVFKELKEQRVFFNKYRPAQPVLNEKLTDHFQGEEISEVLNRNGINGTKMPPTAQMADRIGLKELYDFIYRSSCSFVHFNPRIMHRTVWCQNEDLTKSKISVTNFNKYYFSFSSFYGSYLSGLLFKNFKRPLNISNKNETIIEDIIELVRRKVHYPDLVTYEECNIDRPKTELTVINDFLENQIFEKKDYS